MDETNLNRRVKSDRPGLFRKGTSGLAPGSDTTAYQRAGRILAPEGAGGLIRERRDAELRHHT